jgi:hypothetical protein
MKRLLALAALLTATSLAAVAQNGKITGKLTYPSDYIPTTMIVCVYAADGLPGDRYCSSDNASNLRKAGFIFRVNHRAASYQVQLPAGSYYLYATFPKGKAPVADYEYYKAYYNEFVRCGMSVDCPSKRNIAVDVRAGRTTGGITLGDWYP